MWLHLFTMRTLKISCQPSTLSTSKSWSNLERWIPSNSLLSTCRHLWQTSVKLGLEKSARSRTPILSSIWTPITINKAITWSINLCLRKCLPFKRPNKWSKKSLRSPLCTSLNKGIILFKETLTFTTVFPSLYLAYSRLKSSWNSKNGSQTQRYGTLLWRILLGSTSSKRPLRARKTSNLCFSKKSKLSKTSSRWGWRSKGTKLAWSFHKWNEMNR